MVGAGGGGKRPPNKKAPRNDGVAAARQIQLLILLTDLKREDIGIFRQRLSSAFRTPANTPQKRRLGAPSVSMNPKWRRRLKLLQHRRLSKRSPLASDPH